MEFVKSNANNPSAAHHGSPSVPLLRERRGQYPACHERRKLFESLPPSERASKLALEQRRTEALIMFEAGDTEGAERHFFGEPAKAGNSGAEAAHNNGHANPERSEAGAPACVASACTVVSDMGFELKVEPTPKPEPVRADNLNEGFPGSKLPPLPSGTRGESRVQRADFKDFKGLSEEPMKSEPLPPPNPQAAAALNFGFPSELLHGST